MLNIEYIGCNYTNYIHFYVRLLDARGESNVYFKVENSKF